MEKQAVGWSLRNAYLDREQTGNRIYENRRGAVEGGKKSAGEEQRLGGGEGTSQSTKTMHENSIMEPITLYIDLKKLIKKINLILWQKKSK